MFEFLALSVLTVGVIEELVIPVGTQVVGNVEWAVHQVAARVDMVLN